MEDVGLSGMTAQIYDDCVSLVYIIASDEHASRLPRAAQRIRRNVRCTDTVLLLAHTCAIILPETPLQGAQAVARRVATLLVDIDCELQAFYGLSALTIWQRLQSKRAIDVHAGSLESMGSADVGMYFIASTRSIESVGDEEEAMMEHPHAGAETNSATNQSSQSIQPVPYLAVIADYPSRRLLHLFPYELACRYQCVPVGMERDMLTIGISQPLDDAIIAHFEQVTRHGIFQVRCEAGMIYDVLLYWQRVEEVENVNHDGRMLTEPQSVRQLI